MGEILGQFAETVRSGLWSPQATRLVNIPKHGSDEFRTIQLSSLLDRILYRALYDLVSPEFDRKFSPQSYGFRPAKSTVGMLAAVAATIERTGADFVVNCDIRRAFDSVQIDDVIEAHDKAFSASLSDEVISIIETALRGFEKAEIGIPQGNAYSPFALNLLLHYAHDIRLQELGVTPFWFRYADNLVYLTQNVNEGKRVVGKITTALGEVGLELKPERDLVNITCLLYTSPSPRDATLSRMPSSA